MLYNYYEYDKQIEPSIYIKKDYRIKTKIFTSSIIIILLTLSVNGCIDSPIEYEGTIDIIEEKNELYEVTFIGSGTGWGTGTYVVNKSNTEAIEILKEANDNKRLVKIDFKVEIGYDTITKIRYSK